MALVRAERVMETSTTTGTGSMSLAGAVAGYRTFTSVMATNDTCYYAIVAIDSSGRPTGDWETGLGTLTASTTFSRTSPAASSNSNNLVSFTSGTKQVFLAFTAAEAADIYTQIATKGKVNEVYILNSSNSAWPVPTGAVSLHVVAIGGGGGGQGGSRGADSATNGNAGGGGGGGARVVGVFPASALGSTVNIQIGDGGTGGNGQTSSVARSSGGDGGTTSFGSFLFAPGGSGATGSGLTLGGLTASTSSPVRIVGSNGGYGNVTSNTASVINTDTAATGGGGGGGTGGGGTTPASTAGNLGSPLFLNTALTIGTDGSAGGNTSTANATATAGGAGTSRSGSTYAGGGGGGGGSQTATTGTTGVGGAGGAGGLPGGGGGGGGSCRSTSTAAGKGGDGAKGQMIITVYY